MHMHVDVCIHAYSYTHNICCESVHGRQQTLQQLKFGGDLAPFFRINGCLEDGRTLILRLCVCMDSYWKKKSMPPRKRTKEGRRIGTGGQRNILATCK